MKYVEVKFPKNDILPYLLGEIGFESFMEDGECLLAYIRETDFDEHALRTMLAECGGMCADVKYSWSVTEDRDWNEEWEKSGFEPIAVDDKIVIHDLRHVPQKAFPIDIIIDARQAFGTGTHQTTQMMLQALMKLHGKHGNEMFRLLDCGCGTGILGIAARKLGINEVWAYDIDEWSVENTVHNCIQNDTGNLFALCGDASVLGKEIKGDFDIVLANINRDILIADVPRLSAVLKSSGFLIVSGFYQSDSNVVETEFSRFGLEVCGRLVKDSWTCLMFKKILP